MNFRRKPSIGSLAALVTNLLFPPRCVGCGRLGLLLCPSCLQAAPRLRPPYCQKCGKPLGTSPGTRLLSKSSLCPLCQESPLEIEGVRSPYLFTGVMRQAIHAFKYGDLSSLAPLLGHLLAEYMGDNPMPVEVVVPVPLHPQRRRERGYDQAELLAGHLAQGLGLPLGRGWLVRQRPTPPQVRTTSAAERRENVQGAFAPGAALEPGRAVLLVDDVCTTGATLEACARALRQGGAAAVWGLTLAREG